MPDPTPPVAPKAAPRRSVLAWAERKETPPWLLRATAARMRWEIRAGANASETTEAEFDTAIDQARSGRC